MTDRRILWISSVATVIVLVLVDLSHGQYFAPFAWTFQNYDRAHEPPSNVIAITPSPAIGGIRQYSQYAPNPPPPKYLSSYYPAAMQLLHYFSERMQYEEFQSTTVAPPYTGGDYEVPIIDNAQAKPPQSPSTTPLPPTTTTTARTTTTRATTTTTRTPTTRPPFPVESTTAIHRPGLFAPVPPQYQMQLDAQYPHDSVHAPTKKPPVTNRPVVTRKTTARPTTRATVRTTTRRKPWSTTTTTRRPITTTKRRQPPPRENYPEYTTTKRPLNPQTLAESNGFLTWFFENAPSAIKHQAYKDDSKDLYDVLDPLPRDLLNDIESEGLSLPALRDEDNVREFLKKYDDSFGRHVPSQTGNKIKPPTKPFVEFLVLYDLMKRDAKTKMFSDYHGYSDDTLKILAATSHMSSERQLHYVLSAVYSSSEVDTPSIKTRMSSIIKDLENPNSITSMTIREIPAFIFLL